MVEDRPFDVIVWLEFFGGDRVRPRPLDPKVTELNTPKPIAAKRLPKTHPVERLVFFGTPQFAVPTLDALHAAGRTPSLVVSQPTRSAGRGRRATPPPVAQWAHDHGIDLVQTDAVKDPEFMASLRELEPCLAVVVAFGQIFRKPLLELPRLGCVNLHASLLPAYRGASPIVAAIRHGETEAGVSTMVMERGLDSGPVLLQRGLAVGPDETAGELSIRLSELGADLVVETLDVWEAGNLTATPQDHALATHAPMLERSLGDLDWGSEALQIHNLVRAFDPWPGTRSDFRGAPVAIKRTELGERLCAADSDAKPGQVLSLEAGTLWVKAGDNRALGLVELQRQGKRSVGARDFVNGMRVEPGEFFGSLAVD